MLYILLLILIGCLIYNYDYKQSRHGKAEWYAVLCVALILIAGLRYRLGIDTVAYESTYYQLPDLTQFFGNYNFDQTRYGKGYLLLCALCKSIYPDYYFFQFIHATIVTTIIFWFFHKHTKHIFFAIFMYFLMLYFPFTFEVLRESLAVCLVLIGWHFFLKKNIFLYYFFCLLALTFHISAAIMLVIPIFYLPLFKPFFRMGIWFWISVSIFFVGVAYISIKFFDLIRLVGMANIDDYANAYENSKYGEATTLNIIGVIAFFIKGILYPGLTMADLKDNPKIKALQGDKEKLEYMICWYIYISIIVLFINIFYRFNNYFTPFIILGVSDVVFTSVKLIKRRYSFSFGIWGIILLPYLVFLFQVNFQKDEITELSNIYRYYPYSSILFPERDKTREQLFGAYGR